jgi:hypothetical protein
MRRFYAKKGQTAFFEKLAEDPTYFGDAISYDDLQTSSYVVRREVRHANTLLPLLAQNAFSNVELGIQQSLR